MKRKVSVSVALAITLLAMTVTFHITMILSMNIFDSAVKDVTEKQAQYTKIAEMDNYIRGNYYYDIDDTALSDSVSRGFVNGLSDSNNTYYTAEEYALLQDIEAGRVVGIGLVAQKDAATGWFKILKVYDGSPAAVEGVTEGQWLTAVDDIQTKNITGTGSLNALLRGEQGTNVTLTCESYAGEETVYQIQRISYTAPTVESSITSDGYAYIRIYGFTASTAADFDYAVNEAESNDVKGYIFDLRDTSSGYIEYSFDMIDMLCPLGTVAKSQIKSGVKPVMRMSEADAINKPMVCIVNGNTAGCAELFAACVRDLNNGQLVGENTAGKGTLQSRPYQFADGSAVALTYAVLLTGDDVNEYTFNETGLAPDLEVLADYEDNAVLYKPDFTADSQLRRSMELVRTLSRAAGVDTSTEAQTGTGTSSGEEVLQPETSLPEEGGDDPEAGGDEPESTGDGQ